MSTFSEVSAYIARVNAALLEEPIDTRLRIQLDTQISQVLSKFRYQADWSSSEDENASTTLDYDTEAEFGKLKEWVGKNLKIVSNPKLGDGP